MLRPCITKRKVKEGSSILAEGGAIVALSFEMSCMQAMQSLEFEFHDKILKMSQIK